MNNTGIVNAKLWKTSRETVLKILFVLKHFCFRSTGRKSNFCKLDNKELSVFQNEFWLFIDKLRIKALTTFCAKGPAFKDSGFSRSCF